MWAFVTARATSGGAGRATIQRVATFYREGGASPVQEGATTDVVVQRNPVALDLRFAISGNSILVQVQDDGVRTVSWVVEVWQQEAAPL
jgi:hypothetical protein